MYPSTNNLGNTTTTTNFSFTINNPFPPDNNSTTIFEHSTTPNFSFHPIHSPNSFCEEDLEPFNEYLMHQQQTTTGMEKHIGEERANIEGLGLVRKYPVGADDANLYNNSTTSTQIQRKRSSKKDRHSKIDTARGPRDRRMRLSLDVAQKFFGLQDMLGFDKASKTVHWLLTQSKSAIKQVTNSRSGGNNNASNTASVSSTSNNSECEVLSGIINNDESSLSLPPEVTTPEKVKPKEKRLATSKAPRGFRAFDPLAKETREKARARARDRTMEKRIRLEIENGNYYNNNMVKKISFREGMDQTLNRHLRSWIPFEASGGEESSCQIHNAPVTWSTSPDPSNYHHNAGISHENQFPEFQCFGTWDHQAYNI